MITHIFVKRRENKNEAVKPEEKRPWRREDGTQMDRVNNDDNYKIAEKG